MPPRRSGGAAPKAVAERDQEELRHLRNVVNILLSIKQVLDYQHRETHVRKFIDYTNENRLIPILLEPEYPVDTSLLSKLTPRSILYFSGMIENHPSSIIIQEFVINEPAVPQVIDGRTYNAYKLSSITYGFDSEGRPTSFESYPLFGRILLHDPETNKMRLFELVCDFIPPDLNPKVIQIRETRSNPLTGYIASLYLLNATASAAAPIAPDVAAHRVNAPGVATASRGTRRQGWAPL
jgi:hypothetical protein